MTDTIAGSGTNGGDNSPPGSEPPKDPPQGDGKWWKFNQADPEDRRKQEEEKKKQEEKLRAMKKKLEDRLTDIETRISTLLKETVDSNLRYEIARIINVLPDAEIRDQPNSEDLLQKITFALDALSKPAPNPETARGIIRQIEVASRKNFTGVFTYFRRLIGNTALNAILAGLLVNLGLVLVGIVANTLLAMWLVTSPAIWTLCREIFWVAAFAYLGSLASLLLKLETYATERGYDPFLLFCNGVCKPFIGIFFALFAYVILKTEFFKVAGMEVIPEGDDTTVLTIKLLAALAVVGFVSGFSERFGPDLVARAEAGLGAGGPPPKKSNNTNGQTQP